MACETVLKKDHNVCFFFPLHVTFNKVAVFSCDIHTLREILSSDAGQLADRLKCFAGQNKYLQD